ncbi:MAG: hypothetical protein JWN79_1865 [Gemmatimonadetes bacterium]|nr:hypothetical protein [Gemmatimonadota bacterium]
MTYDLTRFDVGAVQRCSQGLLAATAASTSMEGAASAVCRHLYDQLVGSRGERASVMVRCYKTHPFGELPGELQRTAKRAFGAVAFSPPDPRMKCLVLLATAGDEPDWNDRRKSKGHQAIPLPSPHIVERAPMIAQLIEELGFDLSQVVRGGAGAAHVAGERSFGIFHVERAKGSPYIPAQDFVEAHAVESVLGFGGALPAGDIYAAIVFARVPIPVASADRFRALASDLRTCLVRHESAVFEPADG